MQKWVGRSIKDKNPQIFGFIYLSGVGQLIVTLNYVVEDTKGSIENLAMSRKEI